MYSAPKLRRLASPCFQLTTKCFFRLPLRLASGHAEPVNQAVVQVYAFALTILFSLLLSIWPRYPKKWTGNPLVAILRFLAACAVGLSIIASTFRTAPQVVSWSFNDKISLINLHSEAFNLDKQIVVSHINGLSDVSPGPIKKLWTHTTTPTQPFELKRTIKTTIILSQNNKTQKIGPNLLQAEHVSSTDKYILVSSNKELYNPDSMVITRFNRSGQPEWELKAQQMGIRNARYRKAWRTNSTTLVVIEGEKDRPTLIDRFLWNTYLFVVSINEQSGHINWVRTL